MLIQERLIEENWQAVNESRAYIPWTDEFSVGIQEIDEQHKVLVNLLNNLYEEAIIKQASLTTIHAVLDELVQYTIVHFAVEESLYRIFNYPGYEIHAEQHQHLKKQVIDICIKLKTTENTVSLELLSFLRKWLKEHILQDDKAAASFLLQQNLQKSWSQRSWIGKIWNSLH